MGDEKSNRRWLQFGIGTLLLLIACIAAIMGGFRLGYDRGYSSGQNQRLAESVHAVVYNVEDLTETDASGVPDYDSLIDMIKNTVEKSSWDDTGGNGTMDPFESNHKHELVISQTDTVHEKIRQLLESIRDGGQKIKPPEAK